MTQGPDDTSRVASEPSLRAAGAQAYDAQAYDQQAYDAAPPTMQEHPSMHVGGSGARAVPSVKRTSPGMGAYRPLGEAAAPPEMTVPELAPSPDVAPAPARLEAPAAPTLIDEPSVEISRSLEIEAVKRHHAPTEVDMAAYRRRTEPKRSGDRLLVGLAMAVALVAVVLVGLVAAVLFR